MAPNLDLCDKVKSKANPDAPTRDDLVKECKKQGLRYSGTKKELCDRLKAARRPSRSSSASSGPSSASSSSSRSSGGSFAHLRKHNPKALTNERANAEMDAVTFRGSKYGDVDLFRGILNTVHPSTQRLVVRRWWGPRQRRSPPAPPAPLVPTCPGRVQACSSSP
uniref:SAP domain-containing protein n=1 Tax=viral metagenome TaxID=1070528 RepID=A0A6C0K9E2_9ZZZZ